MSTGPYSCRGGTFDSGSSSTYQVTFLDGFQASFGDGSSASGDFATDVVHIGDVAISNVQFGLATEVNSTTGFAIGLMGIGYSLLEASPIPYANMPEVLCDAGAIHSRLYSVFLNDASDSSGTILFGGIDISKYTGSLHTLNLLPVPLPTSDGGTIDVVYEFVVAITALSITSSGKTTNYFSNGPVSGGTGSLKVLLDTGSAAWTVPADVYQSVAKLLPALDQYGHLPCSGQNHDITLTLTFGGSVDIDVPIRELIVPMYDALTNEANMTSTGESLCAFMLTPGQATVDQPFLTLGDAILRSMYLVFDLDNGQVSIAQARTNTSTDELGHSPGNNIKVVQAGSSGVANAVGNSGVLTVDANSATIAPSVSAIELFGLVTTSPALGQVTGINAVPEAGRVSTTSNGDSGDVSGGGASASGSSSTVAASSFGVAARRLVPPVQSNVVIAGISALFSMGIGAALLL